ncbi:branched-chain amino acid exporter BrnE [Nesterenkonia halophila]
MPETGYVVAVVAVVFAITFGLRALPFALVMPLRESAFLRSLAAWMPAGLMVVLAATTLRDAAGASLGHLPHAGVAVAVTVATHLGSGRSTLLSVGAGTLTFVGLVHVF